MPSNAEVESQFGTPLERTARLWQDALWPLAKAGSGFARAGEAEELLDCVLHSLQAASTKPMQLRSVVVC
jgi:hypothetical protein